MSLSTPPLSPAAGSPARAPGTTRRTTHLDVQLTGPGVEEHLGPEAGFVDVAAATELHVDAAARDLVTGADGEAHVVAEQRLALVTDQRREVLRVAADPQRADVTELLGRRIGAGFRTSVTSLLEANSGTPYALLLFDLPTIGLISGFAVMQRLRKVGAAPGRITPPELLPHVTDVCAGWGAGTSLVESVAAGQGVPFRAIAHAPRLERDEDPHSWHHIGPLPTGAMRRRRRIDVRPVAGRLQIDAMFRDTYGDPDDGEIVLHEYGLVATFEATEERRLLAIEATPYVLPQRECPLAVPNVTDLIGTPAAQLRTATRTELSGSRGCTHLNDLINTLAELPPLPPPGGGDRLARDHARP